MWVPCCNKSLGFGVCIRAPDFWKLLHTYSREPTEKMALVAEVEQPSKVVGLAPIRI